MLFGYPLDKSYDQCDRYTKQVYTMHQSSPIPLILGLNTTRSLLLLEHPGLSGSNPLGMFKIMVSFLESWLLHMALQKESRTQKFARFDTRAHTMIGVVASGSKHLA